METLKCDNVMLLTNLQLLNLKNNSIQVDDCVKVCCVACIIHFQNSCHNHQWPSWYGHKRVSHSSLT